MKKIKKYITFIILGGVAVLSITLINGWRLDDYTIPKNRTREQYDFEGTFEPMFKFLEQEKKDFTGLKGYISHVYIEHGDGKLTYSSEISPLFDEEILNLVVQRNYFESLDVKETFKSAETELRDIIYQPENHSELYKTLKNKYDLSDDAKCTISIDHSSGTIYSLTIQMKSKVKTVQIDLTIFKQ